MLKKINIDDFLSYIKQENPKHFNFFTKKNSLLKKILSIFYLQEYIKLTLEKQTNISINYTHKDNFLLIPINIDQL